MKKQIMLDLETMGNSSTAPIVSIGAVVFEPETGQTGPEFSIVVNLNSSAHYGNIDGSTVQWWLQQSDEARVIFAKEMPKATLKVALQALNAWLAEQGKAKELCLWGNGSGFDNVILMNAYKACRIQPNFTHWNDRDCRTIVDMGKEILGINPKEELPREGTHHSALDDAKFQAKYVSAIWRGFMDVAAGGTSV